MAITTLAEYSTALKLNILRSQQQIAAQDAWQSTLTRSQIPAAAGSFVLAVTTTGAVPTDATAGSPNIADFSGVGYTTGYEWGGDRFSLNGGNLAWHVGLVYDRLFHCGSYTGNAATTNLGSQPSYSSRIPGGNYNGTQLWIEAAVTAAFPSVLITVTYTNQAGTTGKSTSYTTPGVSQNGLSFQMPLAAGDSGIQTIESVTWGTNLGADSFNIFVARPLHMFGLPGQSIGQGSRRRGIGQAAMNTIYNDSSINILVRGNTSSASGTIVFDLEIAAA